jgi:hypothetical protein
MIYGFIIDKSDDKEQRVLHFRSGWRFILRWLSNYIWACLELLFYHRLVMRNLDYEYSRKEIFGHLWRFSSIFWISIAESFNSKKSFQTNRISDQVTVPRKIQSFEVKENSSGFNEFSRQPTFATDQRN